jgi:hypothetical protein
MSEIQQTSTQDQKESIENLAKLLKEHYNSLYERILSGQSTLLLAKIAERYSLTEDTLMNEIVTFEAESIIREVEMASSKIKALQDMVQNMRYAP